MALRTREEYIESLRRQEPRVYLGGEQIENIVDHPAFRVGINSAAVTYELGQDPQYRELATVMSPIINEDISRWTHVILPIAGSLADRGIKPSLDLCNNFKEVCHGHGWHGLSA
ncbi:MAG TPA: 4-hydroxyphenylacetate 3-hydroxylase N-terminal domain-containing protein [Dehalococcoidia bacterium]|nr:4-hydroxyphenylacetate 3-hydroxylase N-terminal domain-containing protein [Dehalococcoidia bacterium]